MANNVARALRCVPTVYFYVPGVKRAMGKRDGLKLTDDMCAVLWLTELATTGSGGALQSRVCRAARMTEGRFSTVLAPLVPDFIQSISRAGNRRIHYLKLTKRGQSLLAVIKDERRTFFRDLFKHLSPSQQAACANALTTLEAAMWRAVETD